MSQVVELDTPIMICVNASSRHWREFPTFKCWGVLSWCPLTMSPFSHLQSSGRLPSPFSSLPAPFSLLPSAVSGLPSPFSVSFFICSITSLFLSLFVILLLCFFLYCIVVLTIIGTGIIFCFTACMLLSLFISLLLSFLVWYCITLFFFICFTAALTSFFIFILLFFSYRYFSRFF